MRKYNRSEVEILHGYINNTVERIVALFTVESELSYEHFL